MNWFTHEKGGLNRTVSQEIDKEQITTSINSTYHEKKMEVWENSFTLQK